MLQPNKSDNLVEILEIDAKEETENEETLTKDTEVKLSSESASDNLGETEVKKAPTFLDIVMLSQCYTFAFL